MSTVPVLQVTKIIIIQRCLSPDLYIDVYDLVVIFKNYLFFVYIPLFLGKTMLVTIISDNDSLAGKLSINPKSTHRAAWYRLILNIHKCMRYLK